jgi:phage tail-like protein
MTNSYYPPAGFCFQVLPAPVTPSLGEAADLVFQELSGLDGEVGVEGSGASGFVHRLPRPGKPANLVLRKGVGNDSSPLLAWVRQNVESLGSPIATRTLCVNLVDGSGTIVLSWVVRDAWPVRYELEAFEASSEKIAIETPEFAYSSVDRRTG